MNLSADTLSRIISEECGATAAQRILLRIADEAGGAPLLGAERAALLQGTFRPDTDSGGNLRIEHIPNPEPVIQVRDQHDRFLLPEVGDPGEMRLQFASEAAIHGDPEGLYEFSR
jgi:hypothetical protein